MSTATESQPATWPLSADAEPAAEVPRTARARVARYAPVVLGILIPLLFMLRLALLTPVGFDGAMNLQVAQNVAQGDGFVREYDPAIEVFPSEIQTTGFFLLFAAGAIRAFGESQFAYQFASVVGIAVLLWAISVALKGQPGARWLRLLAPALVFIALPDITGLSVGALGEVPVAGLALVSLLLLTAAMSGSERPYLDTAIAFGVAGVAVTIKVVAVAMVPVLLGGLVLLAVLRPALSKLRLLGAAAAVAIAPLLFEVYRLIELGSVSAYRLYWTRQRTNIGFNFAGAGGRRPGKEVGSSNRIEKALDHLHLLGKESHVQTELLVIYLAVPFAVLAWLIWRNRRELGTWLTDRTNALMVLLSVYAGLYLGWWLLLTPTSVSRLRRVVIGLLAINVLYALLLSKLLRRDRPEAAPATARRRVPPVAVGALVALVAVVTLAPVVWREGRRVVLRNSDRLDHIEAAAADVEQGSPGKRYFGWGWWSSPAVILMADVPLENLSKLDPCDFDPNRDVLIWDQYASGIVGKLPVRGGQLTYEKIADYGGLVRLFSIAPAPGRCPPPATSPA